MRTHSQRRGTRINEYLIGSELCLRGASYSPSEDSIVRRQALTLRHTPQDYYSNEGKDHAVRIELPVGRYVPVFRRVETLKPVLTNYVTPVEPGATAPAPSRMIPRPWWSVAAGCALFVGGLLAGIVFLRPTPAGGQPISDRGEGTVGPLVAAEFYGGYLLQQSNDGSNQTLREVAAPDMDPKRFLAPASWNNRRDTYSICRPADMFITRP